MANFSVDQKFFNWSTIESRDMRDLLQHSVKCKYNNDNNNKSDDEHKCFVLYYSPIHVV